MGIFSKQIIFNYRETRKEIAAKLRNFYWSISDLGEFLKQKGVKLPVCIISYDRFRNIAKLHSESGEYYELKIANTQEARESTREDQISLYLEEFYQNMQDENYWEFWLTNGKESTRYSVGYAPKTYEVGKFIKYENSVIKIEQNENYIGYELLAENGEPRILFQIRGNLNTLNTREIEKYLGNFKCIGGLNSAEKILDEISKSSDFDINQGEDVIIMCQPMGMVTQTEINITKIVLSNGKQLIEFAAEEGTSSYTWKNGSYSYKDTERHIWYNHQKNEYGATAKWYGNSPEICDEVISTIGNTILNLKKRLEE